jgi:hypothetical protein
MRGKLQTGFQQHCKKLWLIRRRRFTTMFSGWMPQFPRFFCSRSSDSEDTYTTTYSSSSSSSNSSSSSSSSRIIGRFFVFFYARLIVAKIHIENKLDVIRRMIIRNNNSVLLENHFLNWVFEKILLQYGLVRNILWALTASTKDACKEPCIRTKGTTKRSITIQKLLITIKHYVIIKQ